MFLHRMATGLLLLSLLEPTGAAAQATPGTDIWAFKVSGNAVSVVPESLVRVTMRAGYDNQPHFPPGERMVLYTQIDSVGQADIWRFDLRTGSHSNVTRSAPESEYSATVMPSLARFSAIRVEADSTQRLWSFESGGTNPEVILEKVQPVGYHAWLNDDTLALFVLGNPATLQIASRAEGTSRVVAENIGRSLHKIPGKDAFSFVRLDRTGAGTITEYDPTSGESSPIAPLLAENEFFAWTPGGTLVMGQGPKLFRWTPGESQEWIEVVDLESAGIMGISRIAFSPEGGWIAVVGEDAGDEGGN
ncbi:MAG: hypothetical protein HKO65_20195 [Gemmatimonadetes bacterium]|nr:hypothetical protein [Gemmatimonadota bacterium]NNM07424.1 hypothetical protein [Gemmatimonadota bacterium]